VYFTDHGTVHAFETSYHFIIREKHIKPLR
jgi:hypothetical protein